MGRTLYCFVLFSKPQQGDTRCIFRASNSYERKYLPLGIEVSAMSSEGCLPSPTLPWRRQARIDLTSRKIPMRQNRPTPINLKG